MLYGNHHEGPSLTKKLHTPPLPNCWKVLHRMIEKNKKGSPLFPFTFRSLFVVLLPEEWLVSSTLLLGPGLRVPVTKPRFVVLGLRVVFWPFPGPGPRSPSQEDRSSSPRLLDLRTVSPGRPLPERADPCKKTETSYSRWVQRFTKVGFRLSSTVVSGLFCGFFLVYRPLN